MAAAAMIPAAKMVPGLAATVTVVDQSGKVVTSSKTMFSAFKNAKEAYKTKKAEIAAERAAEQRAREAIRRRHLNKHSKGPRDQLTIEDVGDSGDSTAIVKHKKKHRKHRSRSADGENNEQALIEAGEEEHTETALATTSSPQNNQLFAASAALDMAAPLLNDPVVTAIQDLFAQVQSIIDEFTAVTFGITTFLSEIQKCPETLGMLALALAEISTTITTIAPGVLPILQASWPTVFALLSSPQFAVVAGVAGAATVVLLGGFKIIKGAIAATTGTEQKSDDEHLAYGDNHDVHEVQMIEPAKKEEIVETITQIPTPLPTPPLEEDKQLEGKKSRKHSKLMIMSAEDIEAKEERRRRRKEKKEREEQKEKEREERRDKKKGSSKANSVASSNKSESGSEAGGTKKRKDTVSLKKMFQGRSA